MLDYLNCCLAPGELNDLDWSSSRAAQLPDIHASIDAILNHAGFLPEATLLNAGLMPIAKLDNAGVEITTELEHPSVMTVTDLKAQRAVMGPLLDNQRIAVATLLINGALIAITMLLGFHTIQTASHRKLGSLVEILRRGDHRNTC